MSNIVVLFLLLLSTISFAQVSIPEKVNSMKEATALLSKAVSGYQLERADTSVAKFKNISLQYVTSDQTIYVRFFKADGYYEFRQISGSFDNMLSFWKQYVQPDADIEKIRSTEQEVVMWKERNKRLVFFKSNGEWIITVRS